jgi:phosphonate transport system substrate-binding protein
MRAEARAGGSHSHDRELSVATHLAPSVLPAYAFAARRIGERLGRPAELVVAGDYSRCLADIDHVCFVCSIPYLLLRDRVAMAPLVAPVLAGRRYEGRPVYFSEVVVHADAPIRSFDGLAGSRWAYNEPFSHSGFGVVLHHLARRGDGPEFIGEWIEAGYHDDALHMILDGRADWAAIDSQVLDLWRRWQPALRRGLRTLEVLGPSTIQPVVASSTRLTPRERQGVTEALLGLDGDPHGRQVLAACGIRRFVAIDDSAYDDIREMLATVEAAGLLPAWWRTRWDALVAESFSPRSPERAPAGRSRGSADRDARPPPRRSSPRPSPPPS